MPFGIINSVICPEPNQKMTLEDLTSFIEAKEAGKLSSASLTGTQAAYAARSSYKKYSNQPTKPMTSPTPPNGRQFRPHHQPNNTRPPTSNGNNPQCGNCGTKSHRFYHWREIKPLCPAQGKTCSKCKALGHFGTMCRTQPKSQATNWVEHTKDTNTTEDDEGVSFLAALASTNLE